LKNLSSEEKRIRIRITELTTPGGLAHEHGKLIKKLMRGLIDPSAASRLSAMMVNHRVILETVKSEARIAELEEMVAEFKRQQAAPSLRVVK